MDRRHLLQAAASGAAALWLPGCTTPGALSQADLILRDGRIHTLDAGNRVVSSIALRDGKVLAIGTDAEVAAVLCGRPDAL